MSDSNYLIISHSPEEDDFSGFLGRFHRFQGNKDESYLKQFDKLPLEFVFYKPLKEKQGHFHGYGKITKEPFEDKRSPGYFFVEIDNYKKFTKNVLFDDLEKDAKKELGDQIGEKHNKIIQISSELLSELCIDGGVKLNFQADAHLVQILGEQLIESERVGILELVKNGFDAGASYSKVRIEKVPGLEELPSKMYHFNEFNGPVIVIEDNGKGMSRSDIEFGWLRPASTIKTDVKDRIKKERSKAIESGNEKAFDKFLEVLKKEHNNRLPLGEKGVGRFACHRLGKNLIIKTKTKDIDFEYVLKINWGDFDNEEGKHKDLNSVGIDLTRQEISRDYGDSNSGTQLIIFGGKENFNLDVDEINKINRTILKLNTPKPNPNSQKSHFNAIFECPQVKNLDIKVDYTEYEPIFSISGMVDEMGIMNYDFKFNPPYHNDIPLAPIDEKNQTIDLRKIKGSKAKWFIEKDGKTLWRTPKCGMFYVHIDIWYRDKPWKDNLDKSFLDYLSDYGGISIYRDGLNVYSAEWGAESDWLGLRQRQIQSAKRLSYYHMLGNVEIQQGINPFLLDKTNREGMVANRAAKDLQLLVQAVTFFMEDYYMGKRDERRHLTGGLLREPKPIIDAAKSSSIILNNIENRYDLEKDPFEILTEFGQPKFRKKRLAEVSKSLANLKRNLDQVEEVHDMLTEQAGFGLGIAVALHEINKTASNFYYGIVELIEDGEYDKVKLEDLKHQTEALEAEMRRISPLRALRNEKAQLINVTKSIKFVSSIFKLRFEEIGIEFKCNLEDDFKIKARFGGLNQIITNLLDNSCYWLNDPDIVDKKIEIKILPEERCMIIADSGPGISESILPYLFQPGYSLKDPKSGLGTYVCKHYMNLMKKRGDIYLAKPNDRIKGLDGAQFFLDFSNVNGE